MVKEEKPDDTQTVKPTGNATEVVIESPAEFENPAEEAEDTQTEDQTGEAMVAVIKDTTGAESPKEKADNIQPDEQAEDVAEAVSESTDDIENLTERASDTKSTDQTDEVAEADIEDSQTGDQAGDTTGAVIESPVDTEILTEKADAIQTNDQSSIATDSNPENLTEETDDTQGDKSTVGSIRAFLGSEDDFKEYAAESPTAVNRHKMSSHINKTGILITAIMMVVAIILLLLATIERKSAKEALVKAKKTVEESLKTGDQIIQTQIQGRDLIIDVLSLTRNSLELERANTDDTEVKRIIGVFINDIDERIAKINDENDLLRNKLKKAD